MSYDTILTEQRGRVLLITLNRPKALNALSRALAQELIHAVVSADADPRIGVGADRLGQILCRRC